MRRNTLVVHYKKISILLFFFFLHYVISTPFRINNQERALIWSISASSTILCPHLM